MADGRHTRRRLKMGVLVPSTNTSVQPEYDAMRPPGVTNHVRGFLLPNMPTRTDAEYERQLENMRATQVDAMDGCSPVSRPLHPGHGGGIGGRRRGHQGPARAAACQE